MPPEGASLILHNVDVRTMDPARPRAGALALRGNRIFALGTEAEGLPLSGPDTRVIDGRGGTLLPGFYESHVHLFEGGASLGRLNVAEVFGAKALRDAVQAFAAAKPDADLLIAYGANYTLFGEGTRITRQQLDAAIPDRPFYMIACDFHTGWANTIALERAGLIHGRDVGPAAEVVMAADGTATGELREGGAMECLSALGPSGGREALGMAGAEPGPVTPDQRAADKACLRAGMTCCARHGITKLINMDGNRYQLELLRELEAEAPLPCRIEVPCRIPIDAAGDPVAKAVAMTRDFASETISCGRVKMFMDGVFDNWTALKLEDYPDRPGFRGAPIVPPELFARLCAQADAAGLQISVHAVGDGAVRHVLDGYEAARHINGPREIRYRVEHIDNIHPDGIPRLRDLGVIASMQPVHPPGSAGLPLEPTVTLMGRESWPLAFNWRAIKDAGVPLRFATDWPISPLDPLHAIQCALTRQPWAEGLPDPRLTLDECLEAYTAQGAHAAFDEDRLGRLAPGMLADLVLVAGDLDSLHRPGDLAVGAVLTICDGRITFEAT
ncbi:amidohydrolase [Roseisalinus antarcticus]|uniref:N-substituted formamide deformylase n=1 Tax=Roseisalinus antarcticus TaxID=254357 RepID=A0A1Y5RES5_9RHOB|nr:amidohydrolase [Roseisalinus antarcticus]SLN14596.1 N-substituted formamide deformylase precursor [Roseisalinus antarcticus]